MCGRFGVVIRDAIGKISSKAANLACGEFDDSLWVLDIAARGGDERCREPPHLVADIEDPILLELGHENAPQR